MKTLKRVGALVLAVVLIVGGLVLWRIIAEPTDAPTSVLHDRPECGHNWSDTIKVIQVKNIVDIPEFNDCQRFIVKAGTAYKYDTTFAIFVSETIGSLEERLARVQPQAVTPPRGTTTTVPGAVPGVAPATPTANLTAATVAVVFAEGPYPTLGIEKGLNCLYVWRYTRTTPAPETDVWSARMVPKPAGTTSCPDTTVARMGTGKDLNVSRAQVADFKDVADYPPVARWDWDAAHDKQYVSIACGIAWCEIYDGSLTPSPALVLSGKESRDERRVRLIKGWYDQQFLATFDASGKPVPSRILGTIVPDTKLKEKKDADFNNKWVHVADISLDAPDSEDAAVAKYTAKFNFIRTPITDPVTLHIKWKPGQTYWKARIRRPGFLGTLFNIKYKNAMRRPPIGSTTTYDPPGVTRWRWMVKDEGTWTRCTLGCCEMSDY